MTSESSVPPERELTEALLALSWPLPRTVADAQSALDRLAQVRTVLSRLEQESVGTEAWWAGQVDALGTQSGFVLEWWLPLLRDPDLEWSPNHQAHLTADLAALASAGARLLDQLGPSSDRRDDLTRGRRGGPVRDWGPAAVPRSQSPGARPQPPADVFGGLAAAAAAPPDPLGAARHRRPSYDFADPSAAAPPPAVFPSRFVPPAAGRWDDDDAEEPGRVVPLGAAGHRRLVPAVLILAAIAGLSWWADSALSGGRPSPAAAGSTRETPVPPGTGAAGLTMPDSPPAPPSSPAPATGTVLDATTVTSVQATLLGGSGAVPQIVVLVTVHTAGTGAVSVTASYYGQKGGSRIAPQSRAWTLTGRTAYRFSVPIANSPYCGGTFHLTLHAGGRSSSAATWPGC